MEKYILECIGMDHYTVIHRMKFMADSYTDARQKADHMVSTMDDVWGTRLCIDYSH